MSHPETQFEGSLGKQPRAPLPELQKPFISSAFSRTPGIVSEQPPTSPRWAEGARGFSERSIEYRLLELGIPPHIKGFTYIREALCMLLEDEKKIFGITKVLYPDIAKRCDTTSTRVERAIRHAIELYWQRESSNHSFSGGCQWREKPSNAEFLATLSRSISLSLHS